MASMGYTCYGRVGMSTGLARDCVAKGGFGVLYDEPETSKFLAAVERLKRKRLRAAHNARQVKQRLRSQLRKLRSS